MSVAEELKQKEQEHAATNGVVRIPVKKRGVLKFQFADDELPFEVDIVDAYDQWYEIDASYFDAAGKLIQAKYLERSRKRREFVQAVVTAAYEDVKKKNESKEVLVPCVSSAEAEGFIAALTREVGELRRFFYPREERASSSPESAPQRPLNFSQ